MLQVFAAIFGISSLVIVHELGHFWMARRFGMRVTHFSIGFGPVLAQHRSRGSGTVFQLCAIPFMGYVKIAGMNPAESIAPNDPTLYANKGVWARMLTTLGGPLANYVVAALLVFVLALSGWRDQRPSEPMVVASVVAGSPAALAGVREGDVFLSVEGREIRSLAQLTEITSQRSGVVTTYLIERDGHVQSIELTPRGPVGRATIGVHAKMELEFRQLSFGRAAVLAVQVPWTLTAQNLVGMIELIAQRSTEGLMGPVGMGKLVAEQAERGLYDFVGILIAISVALGYFNLLPLPFLDGGRLVFLGYELLTRRKPNPRVEMMVHAAGMLALLTLIALVTLRDVMG